MAQHFLYMPDVSAVIQHDSGCCMAKQVTLEALEAEIVDLIDDPVLREQWLNTNIPILESKTPKSYFNTPSDRARLCVHFP